MNTTVDQPNEPRRTYTGAPLVGRRFTRDGVEVYPDPDPRDTHEADFRMWWEKQGREWFSEMRNK